MAFESTLRGFPAASSVRKTYQSVEGGVRQAARSVNSRFDLKGKAQQTRDRSHPESSDFLKEPAAVA